MTQTIATDHPLREPERALIKALAALMIPAEDGLPSAADPAILSPALLALAQQAETTSAALDRLTTLASAQHEKPFTELSHDEQMALLPLWRQQAATFLTLFESTVAACYYRDDRVLRSLDLPARAPFPEGHTVAPTDWSLLEPVRQRPPFYRNV